MTMDPIKKKMLKSKKKKKKIQEDQLQCGYAPN